MTIEDEIERAIRLGAHPLFLYGLVDLAGEGPQQVEFLSAKINEIGQRIYLESEKVCRKNNSL